MFHGSIVALITPFSGSAIDEAALKRLVRWHLDEGSDGIVPVGTTGESPTLSSDEHRRVVDLVVSEVAGQVPVIAGAGSNNPLEAIKHTQHASDAGADAALHVMGYYNRPHQDGIYEHFKAVHDATDLPIVVYNVPPRTIIDIQPETLSRIAGLTRVIGIKDASCDLSRPIREALLIDKDFCFLSGEDPTAVAYNAHGGQGCISVTANIAPALCAQMQSSCQQGQYEVALDIQRRLMPLHRALFVEPSPAGVKFAASLLGLCNSRCRLPLVDLQPQTQQQITRAMTAVGLL